MNAQLKKAKEFDDKYLKQFIGKKIVAAEAQEEQGFLLPIFVFDDGTFAQIWCDPEGNGPGHIGLYSMKTGNQLFPA